MQQSLSVLDAPMYKFKCPTWEVSFHPRIFKCIGTKDSQKAVLKRYESSKNLERLGPTYMILPEVCLELKF
jgi:hypothetical protein